MPECVYRLCHYESRQVFAPGKKEQESSGAVIEEERKVRSTSESDWSKVLQYVIQTNRHSFEATRRRWVADQEVRSVFKNK